MEKETVSFLQILTLFAEVGGLSTFIFAAVAQVKQFGVSGKWLTVAAFVIGLLVGGPYQFFMHPPAVPLDWFWLVMFSLAGGFIATGAYKGIESASGKDRYIEGELLEVTSSDSGSIYVDVK